jgi:hypothetical protein
MMRPTSCGDDDCFKRTLDLSVSAEARRHQCSCLHRGWCDAVCDRAPIMNSPTLLFAQNPLLVLNLVEHSIGCQECRGGSSVITKKHSRPRAARPSWAGP